MLFNTKREKFLFIASKYVKEYKNSAVGSKAIGDNFEDQFINTNNMKNFLQSNSNTLISRRNTYRIDGVQSLSGFNHELDMIIKVESEYYILEFKHYATSEIGKNEFLIFNQKIIDFMLNLNRQGYDQKISSYFITCSRNITDEMRFFCYQWGITLIEPLLRPLEIINVMLRRFLEEKLNGKLISVEYDKLASLYEEAKKLLSITPKNHSQIFNVEKSPQGYYYLEKRLLLSPNICKDILNRHLYINNQTEKILNKYKGEVKQNSLSY